MYDAKTNNGIPYFSRLYAANFEYATVVDDLDGLAVTRKSVLGGNGAVSSYSLGSRSVTRQALSGADVLKMWDSLMAKKKQLEGIASPRKAVGVVIRDW